MPDVMSCRALSQTLWRLILLSLCSIYALKWSPIFNPFYFFSVNCHFDSVPQSPGASDDAVSCAIMLEVLEVITQSDTALKNTILFLFNGAEV